MESSVFSGQNSLFFKAVETNFFYTFAKKPNEANNIHFLSVLSFFHGVFPGRFHVSPDIERQRKSAFLYGTSGNVSLGQIHPTKGETGIRCG